MNNYFSDFISRFGGEALGIKYGTGEEEALNVPRINYITLYNPSWANENSESVQDLSKQILFFVNAEPLSGRSTEESIDKERLIKEQLNVVGLLRGSCSLVSDFGPADQPITIWVSGTALLVIEIVPGYFLAIALSVNTKDDHRRATCSEQLRNMAKLSHRKFTITHSHFDRLRSLYGEGQFCDILQRHWQAFMNSFNAGSDIPFGPQSLQWPNRISRNGFFSFLPPNSFRKSTLKCSESVAHDIRELVTDFGADIGGLLVANLKKDVPKRHGIILSSSFGSNVLCKDTMTDLFNWFDEMDYNKELRAEVLCSEKEQQDLYPRIRRRWKESLQKLENEGEELPSEILDSEEAPSTSFNVNPAATLAMLHPVTLTNKLVVSPLTGTVNGFKSLGSAVSEQLVEAPSWLNRWRGSEEQASGALLEANSEENSDDGLPSGRYVIGLEGEQITRFLANISTKTSSGTQESREYSVVSYLMDEVMVFLVMDSGIEDLEKKEFYTKLESELFVPVIEAITEDVTSGASNLGNSISSLPEPINKAIRGDTQINKVTLDDIDSDFFFMIYDMKDGSYQSSLPELPAFYEPQEIASREKTSFHKVIFHLHDHLIDHFALHNNGKIFTRDDNVSEYLHKFSSNKSNDWLFYSMRHNDKVILIIRNYNHNSKSKTPVVPENTYLAQIADSVYGAANLGFLDNLGGDVRVWLGGLTKAQEE